MFTTTGTDRPTDRTELNKVTLLYVTSSNCRPAAYSTDMRHFLTAACNRYGGALVSKTQRPVDLTDRYS